MYFCSKTHYHEKSPQIWRNVLKQVIPLSVSGNALHSEAIKARASDAERAHASALTDIRRTLLAFPSLASNAAWGSLVGAMHNKISNRGELERKWARNHAREDPEPAKI